MQLILVVCQQCSTVSEEICIRDEETALLISVHYVQPVDLVHIADALRQCLGISTDEKEARARRVSTKGANVARGLKRGMMMPLYTDSGRGRFRGGTNHVIPRSTSS